MNYRTGDGESAALAVSQFLAERLGTANVFHDSRTIRPGDLFDHELLRNVWRSDVLVAIVGPGWLNAGNKKGRAIDDEADWTRREIAEAFRHQVRVVPLLIDNAELPGVVDLPEALADLPRCQFVRLDFRSPDAGLNRLAQVLDVPDNPETPARGHGQRGGIGSITAKTVTAVTDARGPVHIGDSIELMRDDGTRRMRDDR
ncbi:MAG TPA: toll/interleukin-1 receptor domain-containing protein [Actinophytocola sp.]|uniref:toll/interleukin-1 receptor domain-containing protein n=1 Tax=Actinophytocola sp. TaxID=1872138 RepID=UPI002F9441F6